MLDIDIDLLGRYGFDTKNYDNIVQTPYQPNTVTIFSDKVPTNITFGIKFHTFGNRNTITEINKNIPADVFIFDEVNTYSTSAKTTKEIEDFIELHRRKLGFENMFTQKRDITEKALVMIGFEKMEGAKKYYRHSMKGSCLELYFTSGEWMDTTTKHYIMTLSEVVNLIGEKQFEAGRKDKSEEIKKSLYL